MGLPRERFQILIFCVVIERFPFLPLLRHYALLGLVLVPRLTADSHHRQYKPEDELHTTKYKLETADCREDTHGSLHL